MIRAIVFGVALTAIAAAAPGDPDFSADRFKSHVTFLADDLLEGREAGTRGHEIAARYIAAQFALLGVKPGGDAGTYFQKVDLLESTRIGPPATFVLTTAKGPQTFRQGVTALFRGPIGGGTTRLQGAMVFAGYGMTDAAAGYDDYKDLDVRGKIAVVLWGSPKGMDSEIGAHLQSEQGRVAAAHGAIAMLAIQTNATAAAVPWAKVLEYGSEPTTTWVQKDGTPFDPSYGLKAGGLLEPAAAAALFEGSSTTLARILEEADKPGGRPKGFALKTSGTLTVGTRARRYSSPNVIGLIEGSDPKLKNEYVALMGHADHIGVKAGRAADRINNGALDNGAGIATLLEVARALMTGAKTPRRSVLVVASTAEEKGLLGADYFAHYPTVPIERITSAIDLDMPMLLYEFTDVVAYGVGHSTLQDVFQKAGAAMSVKLSPDPMPDQAIFVRSDHYAMVKAGVPAVMLATGMANGGGEAWGKYLGGHYHQPSDDVALPIVWSAGAKFAELNYRVARALADTDAPPQWYAGDYFGNLFAPKAAKAQKPASR